MKPRYKMSLFQHRDMTSNPLATDVKRKESKFNSSYKKQLVHNSNSNLR